MHQLGRATESILVFGYLMKNYYLVVKQHVKVIGCTIDLMREG